MRKDLAICATLVLTCLRKEITNHRLPKNVIPHFYNITTDIYPEDSRFTGSVQIHVNVLEKTDHIILHVVDLFIDKTAVFFGKTEIPLELSYSFKDLEFLVIITRDQLQLGKYRIEIDYHGTINKKRSIGLFANPYETLYGELK